MTHNSHPPRKDDAVLGGQAAPPLNGAILGGLEGVTQRCNSLVPEARMAALKEALNYQRRGLFLVMRALKDPAPLVRQAAYGLLKERTEPEVRRALEDFLVTHGDYERLQKFLVAGAWREADRETKNLLGKACGVIIEGQFRPAQISACPCEDLLLIDRLWVKFSKGHFGFTVQQKIWQSLAATFWDKSEIWGLFADRVGWRVNLYIQQNWKSYDQLTFSLKAPIGHLPYLGDQFGVYTVEDFAKRLQQCQ
ncbi:hypothetical protein BST81_11795 [Leptolyngbya sp. 'hensonii']|uniref:GUN4 domain-containing protein n=1 Tax=Leptolyngbya sp. 'hensonii' TaxID=1922337 RepID=UPI00094F74BC|nr:GUN4 domain-containing protein [Leptolyngbya sp. 'hensonii']OLP18234.1 hypothetical protein BST81_11795 [Leptolyngbya sp. 'hensonii']